MRLQSSSLRRHLRCPVCTARLSDAAEAYVCEGCTTRFPVVDGIPVLIDENRSVFRLDQFVAKEKTFFDPRLHPRSMRSRIARLLYENSIDLKTPALLSRFGHLVTAAAPAPRVLVVGAGVDAAGVDVLRAREQIELLLTDVSLGDGVSLICDAHDIPFDDETFDGVVAQAVLEHVVDPHRCVAEMHRVLKPGGVVYSDVPFMQQVHGGAYDFTRFTHLGHRRLFRHYEEIESGALAGPGLALTWAWRYFLLSFARSKTMIRLMRVIAKLTSFWWKYLDRHLIDRPAALDAASAVYFIGRKSEHVLSDRALVQSYRGAVS